MYLVNEPQGATQCDKFPSSHANPVNRMTSTWNQDKNYLNEMNILGIKERSIRRQKKKKILSCHYRRRSYLSLLSPVQRTITAFLEK